MSKPRQRVGREERRRRNPPFRPLRRAVAMVSAHAPSAALGGLSGIAAGAVSGMIAGAPGIIAGALFGGAVGAAAGAAAGADQREKRDREEALDDMSDSPLDCATPEQGADDSARQQ
jgi:hypothetical protein